MHMRMVCMMVLGDFNIIGPACGPPFSVSQRERERDLEREREIQQSTNVQCMAGNKQGFVLGVPIRDKMRERDACLHCTGGTGGVPNPS